MLFYVFGVWYVRDTVLFVLMGTSMTVSVDLLPNDVDFMLCFLSQ